MSNVTAKDDRQVLKYQPSVTSRVIFHHFVSLIIIKCWNISLDVTDGWYFRTWRSWMPPSMPVALSKWVGLLSLLNLLWVLGSILLVFFIWIAYSLYFSLWACLWPSTMIYYETVYSNSWVEDYMNVFWEILSEL